MAKASHDEASRCFARTSEKDNTMSQTQPRARRLWVAGTALTALGALVTATFTLRTTPAEATQSGAPVATPVSVATVVQSDVATWDEFSGRLEAVERVEIRPRVAGVVEAVHFREGALVKQGDLLITIDPAPYAAEVDRLQAQVAAAQARVLLTKSDVQRLKGCFGHVHRRGRKCF